MLTSIEELAGLELRFVDNEMSPVRNLQQAGDQTVLLVVLPAKMDTISFTVLHTIIQRMKRYYLLRYHDRCIQTRNGNG
jgi:hypothetical protein